jgi:hypothetical protein
LQMIVPLWVHERFGEAGALSESAARSKAFGGLIGRLWRKAEVDRVFR